MYLGTKLIAQTTDTYDLQQAVRLYYTSHAEMINLTLNIN